MDPTIVLIFKDRELLQVSYTSKVAKIATDIKSNVLWKVSFPCGFLEIWQFKLSSSSFCTNYTDCEWIKCFRVNKKMIQL